MGYFVNTASIRRWAETTAARSMLPHLLRKLVWATIDRTNIQKLDFPAYESVQRPGFDGELVVAEGNAWIPNGKSIWELSVDSGSASKAGRDFEKRTDHTPQEVRAISVYVCATCRHWQNKKVWEEEQRSLGKWKDVRAFDADDFEQWLEVAPGVASWFAGKLGIRREGIDDLLTRWSAISNSTRLPLNPQVFLVSREETQKRVREWLGNVPSELLIESRSPSEVIDFFCAFVEAAEEAEKLAIVSKSVLIGSMEAWHSVRDNAFPALLVVDPTVEVSAEEVARAVTHGHHVLLAGQPGALSRNNISLERASEFALRQALETCGLSPVEAEQNARASGGSLAILKRILGRVRTRQSMGWANIASQPAIVASLLLGGWAGANAADRAAIETITGRTYEELEPEFQCLATCRDPLLLHAAGNWRLLSKDDGWFVLGDLVTPTNLRAFCNAAIEVLADDDPKFTLPAKDRIYASIKGKVPKFSQTLKTHMAQTVAFLGAFGERLEAAKNLNIAAAMGQVVEHILSPDATWQRWASIGAKLTLLAEASPTTFLRAVRADLDRSEPELMKLFHQEDEPLFGSCNHAGLLWALETLAWSPLWVTEVCRSLVILAANDPGGRWSNRPDATLCELLSDWMPHTMASVDERIKLLDSMVAIRPDAAWGILLKLLPHPTGGTSTPTHRPMWQDWANAWNRGATRADSLKFMTAVGERVIQQAGTDATRWKAVFENLSRFPYTVHEHLVAGTGRLAFASLSDPDRRLVADELSEQINLHRQLQDADWSLPLEFVEALASGLNDLKPKSCVFQHAWLFDPWPDRYFGRDVNDYQKHEQAIEEGREGAVREIICKLGFKGVELLIAQAKAPTIVGCVLAGVSADQFMQDVIPSQISIGDKNLAFAEGFVSTRFRADGWNWLDSIYNRCAMDSDKASLLVALPFESETWRRGAAGESLRKLYWERCRAWGHQLNAGDLCFAVEALIEFHRPSAAIGLLATAIYKKLDIPTATLMLPLESILELDPSVSAEEVKRMDMHNVGEIIELLQQRPDADITKLSRIEWNFLGILGEHSGREPKTLYRQLTDDPVLFVDFLKTLYRSKDEIAGNVPCEPASQERVAIANLGWQLLRDWKRIPGTIDDGSVAEHILRTWCAEARRLSAECGRIEVCDVHLGELFAHAPHDADGKWPCKPVRTVIESIATSSLRSGLSCGIQNSRGAGFRGKGGNQERALADKYRKMADLIRFESSFIAEILDGVCGSYEYEAKQWDETDKWAE